jgi:hypothetical protein
LSDIVLPWGLSPEEIKDNVLANLYDYPPEIQYVIREFSIRWKIPPPPKGTSLFGKWVKDAKEIKEQIESAGVSAEKVFEETYYIWKTPHHNNVSRKDFEGRFEVLNLGSVVNLTWTAVCNIATGNTKRKVKVYTNAQGEKIEKER